MNNSIKILISLILISIVSTSIVYFGLAYNMMSNNRGKELYPFNYEPGEIIGYFKVTLNLNFVDENGREVSDLMVYVLSDTVYEGEASNLSNKYIFYESKIASPRVTIKFDVPAIILGSYIEKGFIRPIYKDITLHLIAFKKSGSSVLIGDKIIRIDSRVNRTETISLKDTVTLVNQGKYTNDECVNPPPYYKEEFEYKYTPIVRYAIDTGITGWIKIQYNSRIDIEGKYRYYWFDEQAGCWKRDNYWSSTVGSVLTDVGVRSVKYSGIKTVTIYMKVKYKHYIWALSDNLAIEEIIPVDTMEDPIGTLHYKTSDTINKPTPDEHRDSNPGETVEIPLGTASYWQFHISISFNIGPVSVTLGISHVKESRPILLCISTNQYNQPGLYVRTYSYNNSKYEKSYTIWF